MGGEGTTSLLHTVGEWETEARGKQLLNVRATDISSLLDLDDPEDLETSVCRGSVLSGK